MEIAMQIREATTSDFAQLMGIYRQLHPDDPALSDGREREVFEQIRDTPDLYLFVIDIEGRIIATCYLNIIPNITRAARPYAIIENVVTDERERGRGFGKRIIAHTLDFAWSRGCYKAMLQTGSTRDSTHAFYRACGFSAQEKVGYVARPR
jgi:GNAT superfamily N-acetyltransferase